MTEAHRKLQVLSRFEIMPPQPDKNFLGNLENFRRSLQESGFSNGSVIEITFHPPRSTNRYNPQAKVDSMIETAKAILELGFIPYPHLSARALSKGAARRAVEEFSNIGVQELFLVAGDQKEPISHDLVDSVQLAHLALSVNPRLTELGFAAYPDFYHPSIPNVAIASFMFAKSRLKDDFPDLNIAFQTQFAVNAPEINALALELTQSCWNSPIFRVGALGPSNMRTLLKTAEMAGYSSLDLFKAYPNLGVGIALEILQKALGFKLPLPNKFNYSPEKLINDLNNLSDLSPNIEGIYFYTTNNFAGSAALYRQLTPLNY